MERLEIISHDDFGCLRLSHFLASDAVREVSGWEYMDDEWIAEVAGFTEVLRPAHSADVVRAVSLDLDDLPAETQDDLLAALCLPLRRGMVLGELISVLGDPVMTLRFPHVLDRRTYVFDVGVQSRYTVQCTVRESTGLSYVTVMAEAS